METDSNLTAHRLVHLDLKGAAFRMTYFEQLLPLLRLWGATGLLLEYEDMFPYQGSLSVIACSDAYSLTDVQDILRLAALNDLIVIPLIQTFGHVEFILKHDSLIHLREVSLYPNSICPSKEQSRQLIEEMIRQIIAAHPDSRWIHIGADEVWQLGQCGDCIERMHNNSLTRDALFLHHVIAISRFIKENYSNLVPIVWDDMFRFTDVNLLNESQIGAWVEPMVWNYTTSTQQFPAGFWDKLSAVFSTVWVASAFKGSTGAEQMLPVVNYHLENHLLWLATLPIIQEKFKLFRGWALTGWQRYDHFAVLCELLPNGIPSLVYCLQTIVNVWTSAPLMNSVGNISTSYQQSVKILSEVDHGTLRDTRTFNEKVNSTTSKLLGSLIPLDTDKLSRADVDRLNFPGWQIFEETQKFIKIKKQWEELKNGVSFKGWFSGYHVKYRSFNPLHVQPIADDVALLKTLLLDFRKRMEFLLDNIYFSKTSEEWLIENVDSELHSIISVHEQLTHLGLIKS